MTEQEALGIVTDTITQMAGERRPLMQRVLPESDIHWWTHYPDDDARDRLTRSRYYYHVHEPGDRDPGEHGHFHLFLHLTQIDPATVAMAEPAQGEEAAAHVVHIAGLSIDNRGVPTSWFTTNRWVTDEFMYPADILAAHLDRFNVDNAEEDPLVDRFLTAMVALHRRELGGLLAARDARLAEISAGRSDGDVFEAGHDILSVIPIDLDAKVRGISPEQSSGSV